MSITASVPTVATGMMPRQYHLAPLQGPEATAYNQAEVPARPLVLPQEAGHRRPRERLAWLGTPDQVLQGRCEESLSYCWVCHHG
jgi:hypothetical protein